RVAAHAFALDHRLMKKLLITDFDNTLYDWVSYFAPSFDAMSSALAEITGISKDALLDEFKSVHQRLGTSEQPFAALALSSIRARFEGLDRYELLRTIDPALHAFNVTRQSTLQLYPGVLDALATLRSRGVRVVGHTEAHEINARYRLHRLKIEEFFERLYVLD